MNNKIIDLEPKYLDMVKDILRQCLGSSGVKVYIFGSRVNRRTKKTSDIDLALESKNSEKLDYIKVVCRLKDAFVESNIKYSVDVLDLNTISDNFKSCIVDDLIEVEY